MDFIKNWILTAIAVAVAAFFVPGIQPIGGTHAWVAFALVALFLGLVNALVKPIVTLISLPVTILTLGIFQLVVNTFMLELASWLSINLMGAGIYIAGFGSAFMGAIIVSLVSAILGVSSTR